MRLELLLLLSGSGRAWEVTGTDWSWQAHPVEDPFWMDLESFPTDEVDPDEVGDALDEAMATWTALGLDMALSSAGEDTGLALEANGRFEILHAAYDDMDTVLAFTGAWVWDTDGAGFDCDLVFLDYNDYMDIVWDADPDGPAGGAIDLQSVALHELGHCLGLGHSSDSSAVMYAYYAGLRELAEDDIDGATALFDAGCTDGDGDGVSDCDGDCDDANAAISPAAEEVCDGVDDNCNGAVDEISETTVSLYKDGTSEESGWVSAGNAFRVDHATTLRSLRQQMDVDEGARLVWSVYRSDDGGETWSMVTEARGEASADAWQQSPDLNVTLDEGVVYEASLGALGYLTVHYQRRPDLEPQGPITPLGYVVSRALGDQNEDVNSTWLVNQELIFTAPADADGDGETELCGDCAPEDGGVYSAAAELCDGVDQDCDGVADEDFADSDTDGVVDCLDPCPQDPLDDQDGDGACADADPCPEDPLDACDDPGPDSAETGETAETGTPAESGGAEGEGEKEGEDPGGCACAQGSPGGAGLAGLAALLGLSRRIRRAAPRPGARRGSR